MVAIAVAAVAWTRPSDACGPLPGVSLVARSVVPANWGIVPANLPAIWVSPPLGGNEKCTIASLELLNTAQQPVALTASPGQPYLHLLSEELVPGASYVIRYDETCSSVTSDAPTVKPYKEYFTASAIAPLPTTTGTLELVEEGTGSVRYYEYSCLWGARAAWARVKIQPACELVPFLPVTRFVARVDGAFWGRSEIATTEVGTGIRRIDLVHSECGQQLHLHLAGTSAGKHTLEIRAEILGSSVAIAPATLTVDLSCDDASVKDPVDDPDPLDIEHACWPEPRPEPVPPADDAGPAASAVEPGGGGCSCALGARSRAPFRHGIGIALGLLALVRRGVSRAAFARSGDADQSRRAPARRSWRAVRSGAP